MGPEFCVLDTEGAPTLREIAVVDARGQLIFEARIPSEEDSYHAEDLVRPLPDLLRDLRDLLRGRTVVAHNAAHDRNVLEASFAACGLTPPSLEWVCTLQLAQALHPAQDSHALGALCDALEVGTEPFHPDAAHRAAYDARFTALLHRRLRGDQLSRQLADAPNPFSSSRVDTPFQHVADDRHIHQGAFQRLSAVLGSVAADPNRQSQGAVLIGEPGSGKTHLVMRLAEEVLSSNRLLFIRQPTQADGVLFHIYSRALESLVERVGEGGPSQMDLLLICSTRRLFADPATERDREILNALEAEDLERLGREGGEARRQRWERIETRLLRWWADVHSASGSGRQILQGLLRFCRYSEPRRRESCRRWLATGEHEPVDRELEGLSPWNSEERREEFSLQALRVIGRLCCLDRPLILVFDQLEGLWLEGNRPVLLRFGEVIKELFTHVPHALILVTLFPDRWQQFQNDFDGSISGRVAQHVIPLEQPRPDQIEEILDLRLQPLGARALELFSGDELETIVRQPSIRSGLNRAGAVFEHRVRGVPLPPPPPSSVARPAPGGAGVPQQLLRLEQRLDQILLRLEQLEQLDRRGAGGEASASEPVRESVDGDPLYGDLFRRYRDAALGTLQRRWAQPQIVDDSDDAGKLRQIALGYGEIRALEIGTLRLGNRRVPDNVLIQTPEARRCIAFLHVANGASVQSRLRNLNQLVLRHRDVQFILMREASAPPIRSAAASQALQAFCNGSGDGRPRTLLRPLDPERRVALEFVHLLVSDILNRELDLPLREGLELLAHHNPGNWVVKLLHPNRRIG